MKEHAYFLGLHGDVQQGRVFHHEEFEGVKRGREADRVAFVVGYRRGDLRSFMLRQ